MLYDNGFIYTFHQNRDHGNFKLGRCRESNHECRGRLHTNRNNETIERRSIHNHESNLTAGKVKIKNPKINEGQ